MSLFLTTTQVDLYAASRPAPFEPPVLGDLRGTWDGHLSLGDTTPAENGGKGGRVTRTGLLSLPVDVPAAKGDVAVVEGVEWTVDAVDQIRGLGLDRLRCEVSREEGR